MSDHSDTILKALAHALKELGREVEEFFKARPHLPLSPVRIGFTGRVGWPFEDEDGKLNWKELFVDGESCPFTDGDRLMEAAETMAWDCYWEPMLVLGVIRQIETAREWVARRRGLRAALLKDQTEELKELEARAVLGHLGAT